MVQKYPRDVQRGSQGVQEADGSRAAKGAAARSSTRLCGRRAYSCWGWGLALKGLRRVQTSGMTLRFSPRAGIVAICRFPSPGTAVGAEMVKTRPVIVVSRVLHGRHGVATVVPVSMTPPTEPKRWHVLVPATAMPRGWREKPGDRWAKCDMVVTVSLERLSMSGVRRHEGRLHYTSAEIDDRTLRQIRHALAYILELF